MYKSTLNNKMFSLMYLTSWQTQKLTMKSNLISMVPIIMLLKMQINNNKYFHTFQIIIITTNINNKFIYNKKGLII